MTRAFASLPLILFLGGCATHRAAYAPPQPPPIVVQNARPGEIPPGVVLEILTNEPISESSAGDGRVYSAQTACDVIGRHKKVLIPRGSPVEILVLDVKERGRIRGNTLELAIQGITINGHRYDTHTAPFKAESGGLGANQRTAEMVGGGAAAGAAAVGSISGSSKGAAAGALAGAVIGAITQVMTQDKEIQIPAESILAFRFDQPLQVY